jgi:hypothetical protein
MEVQAHVFADCRSLLQIAQEWLTSQLPTSNFTLGLLLSIRHMPHMTHPEPFFCVVERADSKQIGAATTILAVSLMTPPHPWNTYLDHRLDAAQDAESQHLKTLVCQHLSSAIMSYQHAASDTLPRPLSKIFTTRTLAPMLAETFEQLRVQTHGGSDGSKQWQVDMLQRVLGITRDTERINRAGHEAFGLLQRPCSERVAAGGMRKATTLEWPLGSSPIVSEPKALSER